MPSAAACRNAQINGTRCSSADRMITSRLTRTKGSGATIEPPPGGTPEPGNDRFDLSRVVDGGCRDLDRQTGPNGSKFPEVKVKIRSEVRIEHEAGADNARRDLFEQLQPFANHLEINKGEAGYVAARMRQVRHLSSGILPKQRSV